ncbi:MAG: hypothetical protein D6772_09775 [Bacteroidetes bacterium]|nr:MAG: hypothetical protein D6772_09775 [Bacteroidota bacterium]
MIGLLALPFFTYGQSIWPGDVNNNGLVNTVDLLYWGVAFGSSGPERAEQGADWRPYAAPAPWSAQFPEGTNYAFADCNGNGLVDEDDLDDAIENNFALTSRVPDADGYRNAAPAAAAPRLRLVPSVGAVEPGTPLTISLAIEDAPTNPTDFYGLALQMSYTADLLEGDDGPDFDMDPNNWIAADDSYVEDIYEDTGAGGTAELGITRTNQVAIPVQPGQIGNFSIVIEDIIVGLEVDTFILQIDSVKLVTPDLTTIAVVPDTATVIVARDLSILTTAAEVYTPSPDWSVRIFPNPIARGEALFFSSNLPLPTAPAAEVFDPGGRSYPVQLRPVATDRYRIIKPTIAYPPGLYYLRLRSAYGILIKKFNIL